MGSILDTIKSWQNKNKQTREIVNGRGSNGPIATPSDYIPKSEQISTYGEQQQAQASMDDIYKRAQAGDTEAMKQVGQATDRLRTATTQVEDMKNRGNAAYLEDRQKVQEEHPASMMGIQPTDENGKAYAEYTLQDVINAVGDDKEKVQEWLQQHPEYEIGEKTKAYLSGGEDVTRTNSTTSNSNNLSSNSNDVSTGNSSMVENQELQETNQELQQADTPEEMEEAVTESFGDKKVSERAQKDIRHATRGIWQAYTDGEFGEPGSPEAKQARNYFMLNSMLTFAKNWDNAERQHLSNLSNAIAGRELDFSNTNTEKSKWQQMQDDALNRYKTGMDTAAQSDYDTAANIGTAETNAQAAENLGTQGMAQAAAMNQVENGTFDTTTQAFASGDPNKIQAALQAEMDKPVTDQQINELAKKAAELDYKFDEQSFNSRLQGLVANNSLTQAQAQTMLKKIEALGGIENAMTSLASGKMDMATLTKAGLGAAELAILKNMM